MKTYNGHRSWNAWNVALWIGNDETLYRAACTCIERARKHLPTTAKLDRIATDAARRFSLDVIPFGEHTPDGAVYNRLSVKSALLGLME